MIPFQNRFLALKETLLSLSQQTYTKWELLAVDQGSVDGSSALVSSFVASQQNSVLAAPHRGLFAAINLALQRARGDFVLVLEPGDRFASRDSAMRLVSYGSDFDVLFMNYKNLASNEIFRWPHPEDVVALLSLECPLSSFLFSKSFLSEQGGFDEGYLLCAQKGLLACALLNRQIVSRFEDKDGFPLILRDGGNFSYLHHYDFIKLKETSRILETFYFKLGASRLVNE